MYETEVIAKAFQLPRGRRGEKKKTICLYVRMVQQFPCARIKIKQTKFKILSS
jgi:hypothetical protein